MSKARLEITEQHLERLEGQHQRGAPTMTTIMARLERLERGVRWWRGLGIAAVALLGVMVLLGAAGSIDMPLAEEVRTRRLVVVDDQRRPRFVIGSQDFGAQLDLMGLALKDVQGKVRAALYLFPDGGPSLVLHGDTPRLFARMEVDSGTILARSEITLGGPEGQRAQLGTVRRSDGLNSAAVTLSHETDSEVIRGSLGTYTSPLHHSQTGLHLQGAPAINLYDAKPLSPPHVTIGASWFKNRHTGELEAGPVSSIRLYDQRGKRIWHAP